METTQVIDGISCYLDLCYRFEQQRITLTKSDKYPKWMYIPTQFISVKGFPSPTPLFSARPVCEIYFK